MNGHQERNYLQTATAGPTQGTNNGMSMDNGYFDNFARLFASHMRDTFMGNHRISDNYNYTLIPTQTGTNH